MFAIFATCRLYNLSYHSSLHGSIGSILDRAFINQLATSDSSPSSRNIVLKASVTSGLYFNFILGGVLLTRKYILVERARYTFYVKYAAIPSPL